MSNIRYISFAELISEERERERRGREGKGREKGREVFLLAKSSSEIFVAWKGQQVIIITIMRPLK